MKGLLRGKRERERGSEAERLAMAQRRKRKRRKKSDGMLNDIFVWVCVGWWMRLLRVLGVGEESGWRQRDDVQLVICRQGGDIVCV